MHYYRVVVVLAVLDYHLVMVSVFLSFLVFPHQSGIRVLDRVSVHHQIRPLFKKFFKLFRNTKNINLVVVHFYL